jgi:hypothetical protein
LKNKLYGAEFWVPEKHMFKHAPDCLEAFPDAGAACGIVSTAAYESVVRERDEARAECSALLKRAGESTENIERYHLERARSAKLVECFRELLDDIQHNRAFVLFPAINLIAEYDADTKGKAK